MKDEKKVEETVEEVPVVEAAEPEQKEEAPSEEAPAEEEAVKEEPKAEEPKDPKSVDCQVHGKQGVFQYIEPGSSEPTHKACIKCWSLKSCHGLRNFA